MGSVVVQVKTHILKRELVLELSFYVAYPQEWHSLGDLAVVLGTLVGVRVLKYIGQ